MRRGRDPDAISPTTHTAFASQLATIHRSVGMLHTIMVVSADPYRRKSNDPQSSGWHLSPAAERPFYLVTSVFDPRARRCTLGGIATNPGPQLRQIDENSGLAAQFVGNYLRLSRNR